MILAAMSLVVVQKLLFPAGFNWWSCAIARYNYVAFAYYTSSLHMWYSAGKKNSNARESSGSGNIYYRQNESNCYLIVWDIGRVSRCRAFNKKRRETNKVFWHNSIIYFKASQMICLRRAWTSKDIISYLINFLLCFWWIWLMKFIY